MTASFPDLTVGKSVIKLIPTLRRLPSGGGVGIRFPYGFPSVCLFTLWHISQPSTYFLYVSHIRGQKNSWFHCGYLPSSPLLPWYCLRFVLMRFCKQLSWNYLVAASQTSGSLFCGQAVWKVHLQPGFLRPAGVWLPSRNFELLKEHPSDVLSN